jgi:hypothetical protein
LIRSAIDLHAFRVLGALAALVSISAAAEPTSPIRFFEGRTEMISVVKVAMKRPYQSTAISDGRILPDGSLVLVQNVHDERRPAQKRYWKVKQVRSGLFTGTMSDAIGPIVAQEIDGNYRFRFKLKGDLAVEQWLRPLPGGRIAKSNTTVRKFGMTIATSEGTIRRMSGRILVEAVQDKLSY